MISITSEAAKGIVTKPKTFHLCYCLTPTRYLWSGYQDYFQNKAFRFLTKPIISYLRYWDRIASQRPDIYLAISKNIKKRIKKYYHRDSKVIYPPIDIQKWNLPAESEREKKEDYFLVVSRLVKYKKVDLVIKVFNKLGLPLKIVGIGNQERKLKRLARKNIEFLGQLTDKQLLGYYQKSQAVIFPQEEDFGLVPLEGQACGRPVIAYRKGGALETVIEGKTGLFFGSQTQKALIKVVRKFALIKFSPQACRQNAERFNQERFKREIVKFIEEKWENIQS